MTATFVVCEEYPAYRYHIREVKDDLNYGGFSMKPRITLCGLELGGGAFRMGWDTKIPLPRNREDWQNHNHSKVCARCGELFR